MPSFLGFVVFTTQSVHFGVSHLNVLVSFSSIYSFSQATALEELYLSLMGFLVIHHIKEAFGRLEDFDHHFIANAQSIGPTGSTFLDNENSYLHWQPLFYTCVTAFFSVVAASIAFIAEATQTDNYAALFYAIIVIATCWLNIWYFSLFFIMYFRKRGRWYKLHIMSKIQQNARSEYWNFQLVDLPSRDASVFRKYRALVLTNDSYADTVEGLREEIASKGPFLERIREEGKLDAAVKVNEMDDMAADDRAGVGMLHTTANYFTGFVSLYIGILAFLLVAFLAANVTSCNLSSDKADIFGVECTETSY